MVLVSGSHNILLILIKYFWLAVWIDWINWFCKFLNIKRLPVLLEGKTNFLWKSFMATMAFFIYRFIQGGYRSSQVINSLGTKLDMIFIIVSLKTETCSLTSGLLRKVSQSNRSMAFLYDQNLAGRNATQFFYKEMGKKPWNRIYHKSFGDNWNVTKDELQSPLSY